jgi:short-subunit dehydrogenase
MRGLGSATLWLEWIWPRAGNCLKQISLARWLACKRLCQPCAERPVPYMGAYSATKFALNAIGKAARLELKRDNINVLTVCPGYVQTDFGTHVITNKVGNVRPQSVKGISVERVARATYDGYRNRKREVIVPWTMIPMVKLYQLLPGLVEWGMGRMMKK